MVTRIIAIFLGETAVASRLRFLLLILVFNPACGFDRKQSATGASSTPTPSPQVLTQTVPQKPTQARPIDKEWKNKFTFKSHAVSDKNDGFCPYELSAEYPQAGSSL